LIKILKDERTSRHCYALIPNGMPVPIVRDIDGQPRCQYDTNSITDVGIFTLKFEP